MILIDLQKAFDTLDHDVLLKKMKCVGFKKWLLNGSNPFFQIKKFLYQLKQFSPRKAY